MQTPAIYPVIHYRDMQTAVNNALMAQSAGCAGVFLISHHGDDDQLARAGVEIRYHWPKAKIGLNFLSDDVEAAMEAMVVHGFQMLWTDVPGVSSQGLTERGHRLKEFAWAHPFMEVFGSVAFKYQDPEPDPALAARLARLNGFLPTTSGPATGSPPTVDKIRQMSMACGGTLAVASGMTPENVGDFVPWLSAILVSTGISMNSYSFDRAKLDRFMAAVWQSAISPGASSSRSILAEA